MKAYSIRRIKILFLVLLLSGLAGTSVASNGEPIFFTLEIDGQRVGYQKFEWKQKDGMPYFSELMLLELVHGNSRSIVKQEFSSWRMQNDEALYFSTRIDAGTMQEQRSGRILNNRLQLKNNKGSYQDKARLLHANSTYPSGQFEWYSDKTSIPDAQQDFHYFDPQSLSSVDVSISPCVNSQYEVGGARCFLKKQDKNGLKNNERWVFDAAGKLLRIDSHFGGVDMIKKPCEVRCTESVDVPWDFIGRLLVQSPYKIPEKLASGKINYLISSKSGRTLSFLEGAEQKAALSGNKHVVSVCANCKILPQVDVQPIAEYLKANTWVQSDNYQIRRLALSAAPKDAPIRTKMLALVKLTQSKMKGSASYIGYSSALAALHSGSGDCSEFALLLAAFARAQEIPTRIVFGMAYSSRFTGRANVFSPHAWVQVWDRDHWVSYDAALNQFDATHIALAESKGNPVDIIEGFNQLSDIKIDKASAITADH